MHEKDLPGIPATGNPVETTAVVIHRIENGRLVEKWSERDLVRLLQRLEVMPTPDDARWGCRLGPSSPGALSPC
ncbi:ester cyclase [Streptomyces sp. NPDC059929]|uniref:ester cyclase n=1 Tax=Streptomyces sp. NPDC059929 TaxID=3347008 RepID=UPI00364C4822